MPRGQTKGFLGGGSGCLKIIHDCSPSLNPRSVLAVNMHALILVAVLGTLAAALAAAPATFLETHLATMKELLVRRESEGSRLERLKHKIDDVLVDPHAIKFLLDIHDGEDSSCDELCVGYITEKIMEGQSFMNWQVCYLVSLLGCFASYSRRHALFFAPYSNPYSPPFPPRSGLLTPSPRSTGTS